MYMKHMLDRYKRRSFIVENKQGKMLVAVLHKMFFDRAVGTMRYFFSCTHKGRREKVKGWLATPILASKANVGQEIKLSNNNSCLLFSMYETRIEKKL